MKKTVYYFKATFLALCIGGMASVALGQNDPFISVWKTDNDITVPATGDFNYTWGQLDANGDSIPLAIGTGTGSNVETIDFGGNGAGTYRVSITPDNANATPFSRIEFNNAGDKNKLFDIEQWGDIEWTSLENAYYGADSLSISATDTLDLSSVTNMAYAFAATRFANVPGMNGWDVSTINNMEGLFYKDSVFNENIADWEVGGITNMDSMFIDAGKFNQDIGAWDVSQVSGMVEIFRNASEFDQYLGKWDLQSLTDSLSFANSGLGCNNYSTTLHSWLNNSLLPSNIILNAEGCEYSSAVTPDRTELTSTYSWTINNDIVGTCLPAFPENYITIWKTDNPGASNDDEIVIPATGDYTYSWAQIDDSDDTLATGTGVSAAGPINFGGNGAGTYRISITPDNSNSTPFNRIEFNNSGDTNKIVDIKQWGAVAWSSLENAYYGTDSLSISATDLPDLSNVTNMDYAFAVTNISSIPAMNDWDVSTVTNMEGLFYKASVFNQNIADWAVGNVTNMDSMFIDAGKFNQDIGAWDVSQVSGMVEIFRNATKFDQNLEDWDLQSLTDSLSFANSGMGCTNYSKSLHGWLFNPNLPSGITLNAEGCTHSKDFFGDTTVYMNLFNWTITDDGKGTCLNILPDSYITVWQSDNTGTSQDGEITIPATGDYDLYWAELDGTGDSTGVIGVLRTSGAATIDFDGNGPGTYRIKMTPAGANPFDRMNFADAGDKEKILDVEQWGKAAWTSMEEAYFGASNLKISATDIPDLSNLTSMKLAFSGTGLNTVPDFKSWNMSSVTDMSSMFKDASDFNEDISDWNVSNVTDMSSMFENAAAFNDTISGWDLATVTNLESMFKNATSYNSPLNNWNVSAVTNMNAMFNNATSFNQPVVDWDVSSVVDMEDIFLDASSFNQTLGSWNLNSVTGTITLANSGIDCENYSQTIFGWAGNSSTASNIILAADGLTYSPSITPSRANLGDIGWQFFGDTPGTCTGVISNPFVTVWKTNNSGSSSNSQITIPARGKFLYRWVEVGNTSNAGGGTGSFETTISFPSAGSYQVSIYSVPQNSIDYIRFNNGGDKSKLLEIKQWGDIQWGNMKVSYLGAENLEITATDSPDLSNMTDMEYAFGYTNMTTIGNLENWDVSTITNMKYLFYNATNFNQDISSWDIGNVKNMAYMFADATSFNQPIGSWDVSNVTNMSKIFDHASAFNQSLEDWKLRNLNGDISLAYSGIDCHNYSRSLRSWSNDTSTVKELTLFVDDLRFNSPAEYYRQHLIDSMAWTIHGDDLGYCLLGVDKYNTESVKVYPNPTENKLNIDGLQGNETVQLMDITGRILQTTKTNNYSVTLNMDGLADGVYNLIIISENGQIINKKVLKK